MTTKPAPYTGPILFLIHSPGTIDDVLDENERKSIQANKKKAIRALNAAGLRRIPVLYSPRYEESTAELLSQLKYTPRIVKIRTNNFSAAEVSTTLKRARINPTQISCLGLFRKVCVTDWALAAKEAFPHAKINVIEGTHSILLRGANQAKRNSPPNSRKLLQYRKTLFATGIKHAKKLNPRHFV
ncbi:MAG: hypothetical protein NTY48_02495 [Candidatus Diapherotrites archaeon]|nr:hypothetical protein [Candidatus Diapherotrites archaeon]